MIDDGHLSKGACRSSSPSQESMYCAISCIDRDGMKTEDYLAHRGRLSAATFLRQDVHGRDLEAAHRLISVDDPQSLLAVVYYII